MNAGGVDKAYLHRWDCDTAHTPTGGCSRESSTMDESLMERRRVTDEVFRDVKVFYEGWHCDSTSWIRGC